MTPDPVSGMRERVSRETLRECMALAAHRPDKDTPPMALYEGGAMQFSLHEWFERPFVPHGERVWPTYGNVIAILDELDDARTELTSLRKQMDDDGEAFTEVTRTYIARITERDAELTSLRAVAERLKSVEAWNDRLRFAIRDIDAHATPLGEDADGFVATGYAVSVGSLHRALAIEQGVMPVGGHDRHPAVPRLIAQEGGRPRSLLDAGVPCTPDEDGVCRIPRHASLHAGGSR